MCIRDRPYVKGAVMPYYLTVLNYTISNPEETLKEQSPNGWEVTFEMCIRDRQYGELREDLVERLYRRHYDEQQRQQRYHAALNEQDIALYAVLVALVKERRQVTGSPHGENTFRRTRYPGQPAC